MEQYPGSAEGNGEAAEAERWTNRGRGRSRPDQQELRRPHHQTTQPPAQPPQTAEGGVSDIVKNSVLSADAAEFVPKSYTSHPPAHSGHAPRSSAQDRIHLARQAQNVQQAMLQRHQHPQYNYSGQSQHYQQQYGDGGYQAGYQQQQYNQYQVIQDYGQFDGGSGDYVNKHADVRQPRLDNALMQLETHIRTLTMNPGKFDSLLPLLLDLVSPFYDKTSSCEEIFNLIIHQSVNEGNFRYSGARLCLHLDTLAQPVVDKGKQTSVFRETLLNQCTKKTEEICETWRQITKHTDDVEKKCHGLIFFLAELVTQLETTLASELGNLLIRLINTVLQNPAPSSAKNICQALKLAGQTLERLHSGNRSEMEQVMRTLSDLVIQGRVDPHVGRMVTSVNELRSGNWGVISSHTPLHVECRQPTTPQVADEPIFYGPDGQVLTDEESRFLESLAEGELAHQEPWDNDEEDDMIAEAFEEFLKFSQNNNKENKKNVQANNTQ